MRPPLRSVSVVFVALVWVCRLQAGDVQAGSVKNYLLETLRKMKEASADFAKCSRDYADIVKANGGDYAKAMAADGPKLAGLVERMQKDYKAMDSFGYETVEGIVAGVPSLGAYDIYLDAGVPQSEGADNVAPVVLDLGNGEKIDRQGSLFTYIIEPALWAGNPQWVKTFKANGREETLPRAEVLVAAADDVDRKIGSLLADAKAWDATVADCFGAMVVMTPTLSDYFEDWKESRYGDVKSGRFQAVSRISDMRGIMGSCSVMFEAVKSEVARNDKSLAKATSKGFEEIMKFLDMIEDREKRGGIKAAEIDELAEQAKAKTDKLVPQIEQGAAVIGIKVAA